MTEQEKMEHAENILKYVKMDMEMSLRSLRKRVVCNVCDFPTANHHRKKIVRLANGAMRMADDKKLVVAKRFWDLVLLPLKDTIDKADGPLVLDIRLMFEHPASHGKSKSENVTFKTTEPDLTNMAKTIEDSIQRIGAVTNDSRFCTVKLRKFYGPKNGFAVMVAEIEDIMIPYERIGDELEERMTMEKYMEGWYRYE